jgi:hypothetical protein
MTSANIADLTYRLRGYPVASHDLVLRVAADIYPGGRLGARIDSGQRSELAAVLRLLLETEIERFTLRRVLADLIAEARDLPDDGLSPDDILRRLAAAGLDLTDDVADAEDLRTALAAP